MFCPQCGADNVQEAKFCVGCGAQFARAAEPAIKRPVSSPTTPRFAGFWLRTLAIVIDAVLSQVVALVVILPLAFALGASMAAASASVSEIEVAAQGFGFVLSVLIQWLWFTVAESS